VILVRVNDYIYSPNSLLTWIFLRAPKTHLADSKEHAERVPGMVYFEARVLRLNLHPEELSKWCGLERLSNTTPKKLLDMPATAPLRDPSQISNTGCGPTWFDKKSYKVCLELVATLKVNRNLSPNNQEQIIIYTSTATWRGDQVNGVTK
jgi:hypothetical protein